MSTMHTDADLDTDTRRGQILAWIRARIDQLGQPPSLAEIAQAFGFASRNAALKHVQALVAAGLLTQMPGQKRGLRLPPSSRGELLSLSIRGRVAAGTPIEADAGEHGLLWLDRRLFGLRPDYLLRVRGDSMQDDGILDGDLVGVHRSETAQSGQIVVARLEGELTIKRLERGADAIRLLPRNPAYAPIVVAAHQDFALLGLYCGLVRQG